jgi:hypothetical protein
MTPRARALALIITVACLLLIARQVRRRQMRATYLVVWTSLCVVVIPFIAIPGAIDQVSSWIGIYYPPATAFLLAIIVLFLISIHFSRQLTRLEERTRILAEELALLGSEPSGWTDGPLSSAAVAEPAARGLQPPSQRGEEVRGARPEG